MPFPTFSVIFAAYQSPSVYCASHNTPTAQFGVGTKSSPRFAGEVLRRFVKRSVNAYVGVNPHDGQRETWTAEQLALAFEGLAKLRLTEISLALPATKVATSSSPRGDAVRCYIR